VLFKKKTVKTIDDYTKNIPNKVDEYILDKNNIIVVTENINTKEYSMTHYKMENEKLNYVMSWMLCVLDFGGDKLGRKGKYIGKIAVF